MEDIPSDDAPDAGPAPLRLVAPPEAQGMRADKALTLAAPQGLSRSRIAALLRAGAVTREGGGTVLDPGAKVKAGEAFLLTPPAPEDPEPQAEDIPLSIVHEDAHLIVVDKPAGMVVHPAPGSPSGTLVNALLHHCGDSLSGVGGVRRPGIVHRIDKDTSGLLVVAKTDAAHVGLSELFAAHDLDREYLALARGAPDRADARLMGLPGLSWEDGWFRIETLIGRHHSDRKMMAVQRQGGRRAVTWFRREKRLGRASLIRCRLETGRTHQIRVHLTWAGHGLIGDPVYGRGRAAGLPEAARAFPRQALHAARLGFVHPVTGQQLNFTSELPTDLAELVVDLSEQ